MSLSKIDKKCEKCQYRDVCNRMRMVMMAATKPKNNTPKHTIATSRGQRSKSMVIDAAVSNDKIDFDFMQKSLSIIEKRLQNGRKL